MQLPYVFTPQEKLSLIQISDCHLLATPDAVYQGVTPYFHLKRLLTACPSHIPLLFTGDLTQDHSEASYQLLAQLVQDWAAPVFYLPGNHDDVALMQRCFKQAPFQSAQELQSGPWRLLLLDTTGNTPAGDFPEVRMSALAERLIQISADPEALVWLFCHHHPRPIGSFIDELGLKQSDEFCQLLHSVRAVQGVAHGHCHHAYQREAGHWRVVGCPASSVQFAQVADWQPFDAGPQACFWQFEHSGSVSFEFMTLDAQGQLKSVE